MTDLAANTRLDAPKCTSGDITLANGKGVVYPAPFLARFPLRQAGTLQMVK
jgi:hypothetical protein